MNKKMTIATLLSICLLASSAFAWSWSKPAPKPNCQAGYLNNYQCSENYQQQQYRNKDCSLIWMTKQYCFYGCSNEQCNPKPNPTVCSSNITVRDYPNNLGYVDFPNANIGQFVYANNGFQVTANTNCHVLVYLSGSNFPGAVKYRIIQGSYLGSWTVLPAYDSTKTYGGGNQIVAYADYFGGLGNGQSLSIDFVMTYAQPFQQGQLHFETG